MYSGHYPSGDRAGEWFQLYSIGFGGIPGRPLGDGPDGHSLWPSFVNIPCEYLESYYPLRIEKWETVADTGGAGLHRGGNGVDVAYVFEEPGEIAIHDDRWLTYPWGVNGGTPGARGHEVDRARDRRTRGAAVEVPRREGAPGRRAALRHLGRRRLGRPAGARPRAGGAGGPPRPGHRKRAPVATAWWCGDAAQPPDGVAGADAGGPARGAAGVRHGPAPGRAAGALRGGDRPARPEAPAVWQRDDRAARNGVLRARRAGASARRCWSSTCARLLRRRAARSPRLPDAPVPAVAATASLVEIARAAGHPVSWTLGALPSRACGRRPVRPQGAARWPLFAEDADGGSGRAAWAAARAGRAGHRQAVRQRVLRHLAGRHPARRRGRHGRRRWRVDVGLHPRDRHRRPAPRLPAP